MTERTGIHEAGENVFTPYLIRTVTIDGHEHRIGILALIFRGEEAPETPGILFIHPDNMRNSIADEAARYVAMMLEEECEMIIVCCAGDTDETDETADDETVLTPAEKMIRANTKIDLLILPAAPDGEEPETEMRDLNGRKIPVLREADKLQECILTISENSYGMLETRVVRTGAAK